MSSSTITWNGSPVASTVGSSTQISAAIPASYVASAGTATISVLDPAPLSLTSGTLSLTVTAPAPTVTSLSPGSVVVGTGTVSVYVYGSNFNSASVVQAGSTALTTVYSSSGLLRATIPVSLTSTIGTLNLTVVNSTATGGTSAPATFSVIAQPAPSITSLSPSTVVAGAATQSVTVAGQNFATGSVVQFNGTTITPTYQSSTSLTFSLPDSLIAAAGSFNVVVISPGSNGSLTSSPAVFTVTALPAGQFIVNQTANDIVGDPVRNVIYASVPSTAAQNGNSIVTIDATTGTITKTTAAGSEPDRIAISSDGKYLYVASDGDSAVRRFVLPGMTLDFTVSLGSSSFGANTALDLSVAPGSLGVWAVTSGNTGVSPAAQAGVQVYDNAVPRGAQVGRYSSHGGFDLLLGTITWGKDTSTLYGANNESTGFDFYVLPITSTGVGTIADYGSAMASFSNLHIHYDSTTNLVYGDCGYVVDGSGKAAGRFASSGALVPDGTLSKAFITSGSSTSSSGLSIISYDLLKYTPISTFNVPSLTGTPARLVRWGSSGLAFNTLDYNYSSSTYTRTGKIFLYSGSFVK